jgi:dihydrofolate reductase
VKASAFLATSLDGFIARPDGGLDWLEMPATNDDHGFGAFMESIDALVMGRNTYDIVDSMDVAWPYGDTPTFVLTNRPLEIPEDLKGVIEARDVAPPALVEELDRLGHRHLYVDGGATIQSFLDAGLLDRITITTLPILIGEGIPLFGPLADDVELSLVSTVAFTSGLVQSTYDVVR